MKWFNFLLAAFRYFWNMRFDTYIPCSLLKPYVKCIVISENTCETSYKVLPGTSLVLGLQYKGRLSLITDNTHIPLATAGITGLGDRFKVFSNSADIGTILVYFTETGACHFFDVPLNELFTQSVSIDTFFPNSAIAVVKEKLAETATDLGRITVVEQFLLSRYRPIADDTIVGEAIRLIAASSGTIRIKEICQKLHISQSPLEKRFRKTVGATPKKFSSIIRIQNLIKNGSGHNLTDIGYSAGYFDQSHFIKDFKAFTGETPEKFFSGNR